MIIVNRAFLGVRVDCQLSCSYCFLQKKFVPNWPVCKFDLILAILSALTSVAAQCPPFAPFQWIAIVFQIFVFSVSFVIFCMFCAFCVQALLPSACFTLSVSPCAALLYQSCWLYVGKSNLLGIWYSTIVSHHTCYPWLDRNRARCDHLISFTATIFSGSTLNVWCNIHKMVLRLI